jgi:3-oxoacyl-[acyl-carrier-protein] synthase-3
MMRWSTVHLESFGVELPSDVLTSEEIDRRLAPVRRVLNVSEGTLRELTGVRERRQWPVETSMSRVAANAGQRALDRAGVSARDLGALVYCGVSKDALEPATACAIADVLNVAPDAMVFDVGNACLGMLNGMVDVANRIELGQIRAGLVVSAESSRHIIDATIERMNATPSMESFRMSLATMTGGSGAAAVLLTAASFSANERRLVAGAALTAPQHHRLCRWGPPRGLLGETTNEMTTDASAVLEHGVQLGKATWDRLLSETGWRAGDIDRVICHQVGAAHRRMILELLQLEERQDFSTFESLGNMGTVSLPATAAMAEDAGFLVSGQRVAFLGIGSGLNCLMLGVEW